MQVRIPRTAFIRGEPTFAQLIRRVTPNVRLTVFEGAWFRPGSRVDESALWPTPDYPLVPLLIEYAGSDRTGRGHNRSRDLHVLWRYDAVAHEFEEIARSLSVGAEWFRHLAPIVRAEIRRPPRSETARAGEAVTRVLDLLDGELGDMESEGRGVALARLWTQVSARLCHEETGREKTAA